MEHHTHSHNHTKVSPEEVLALLQKETDKRVTQALKT